MHQLVEEADVVREGWNGYNVFHDTASRVAALDVGFLPSARASSAPPAKFVYLLGSDDYREEDIPQNAFVVYQVHLLHMVMQDAAALSALTYTQLVLRWEALCCGMYIMCHIYSGQS